jgi:hypothetical protein
MNQTVEFVEELQADYNDGYERMKNVVNRMSAGGIIGYANTAGPLLDSQADERSFFAGMRDALSEAIDAAVERVPDCIDDLDWRREVK